MGRWLHATGPISTTPYASTVRTRKSIGLPKRLIMNTAHIERSGAAPVPLAAFEDLQYLKLEQPIGFVWVITLNHHDKRNALCVPLLVELARVLAAAEVSDEVRAVVLTGGERFFSAGADIADMGSQGMRTRCASRAGRRSKPFRSR